MRVFRDTYGLTFYVGPWFARVNWDPKASFGWEEGDGPIIRFVRRWWTGWHRWERPDEW